jgi:cytosine/uracil/thiamine/allantoin permease
MIGVAVVLGLALSALVSFLYGLILMLTVGVVHDHWLPSVPTIGYWVAVLVAFTVRGLFTDTRTSPE